MASYHLTSVEGLWSQNREGSPRKQGHIYSVWILVFSATAGVKVPRSQHCESRPNFMNCFKKSPVTYKICFLRYFLPLFVHLLIYFTCVCISTCMPWHTCGNQKIHFGNLVHLLGPWNRALVIILGSMILHLLSCIHGPLYPIYKRNFFPVIAVARCLGSCFRGFFFWYFGNHRFLFVCFYK